MFSVVAAFWATKLDYWEERGNEHPILIDCDSSSEDHRNGRLNLLAWVELSGECDSAGQVKAGVGDHQCDCQETLSLDNGLPSRRFMA
jgi:hypothetical protein